jgi:hypothetical protein
MSQDKNVVFKSQKVKVYICFEMRFQQHTASQLSPPRPLPLPVLVRGQNVELSTRNFDKLQKQLTN